MLLEMTVGLSGPAYSLDPGDKREFPRDEALRLINAGFAVPVAERQIERAVAFPAIETRKQKKSRR
jgi:hypothetical protein